MEDRESSPTLKEWDKVGGFLKGGESHLGEMEMMKGNFRWDTELANNRCCVALREVRGRRHELKTGQAKRCPDSPRRVKRWSSRCRFHRHIVHRSALAWKQRRPSPQRRRRR